jgi:hypothetical protein
MRRIAALALALTIAAQASACAGGAAPGEARAPRRNPNQLNADELSQPAVVTLTALDAVQRLRPTWLRQRGATSVANSGSQLPAIMVNDSFQSMDALRSLRASDVQSMEFLSGADATTLYGTGYVNGLIKVKTGGVTR